MLFTTGALLILDLLEEIVTFIINENKGREIFDFDFPDSFHSQLRISHALEAADTLLRENRRRAADTTEIETAVFVAGIGHLLAAVTLGQHDFTRTVRLQQIDI